MKDADSFFAKPPQSYWIATTAKDCYPQLQEDLTIDVAIIGGGIAGILTAYYLNKSGVKTAVLEANEILQGTTGHTTAKITSQHNLIYHKIRTQISEELAKQYAEANETAIHTYESIIKENKIDCDLVSQSAYVYTMLDHYIEPIRKEAEAASSLNIKATFLEKTPLPFPVKAAVRFENQAQFHPEKFLLFITKEYTDNGGIIYEHTRVVDIAENGNFTLSTLQGKKVFAEKVIIASHYPCYNKNGLYFARIYPERSYALAIQAKEHYPGGMYITAEEPGRSLRSQMSEHGELIIVGGEHHKTGQGPDTSTHYQELLSFAKNNFTVENIPYRWSTQDCMTLDGLPYVGHFTSDTPNLYIATGFGKWGMTNSMVSAMILTNLIVEGQSRWEDVYNPSRHTIAASTKNFVVENLNVAAKIIEGKFEPLPEELELNPGEATVYESNGQRTGAYKDDQGNLHLVDTTCTHMGCELFWNSAEKTWDCPCHGSRFSIDGDIIEGPANTPLKFNNRINPITRLIKDEF